MGRDLNRTQSLVQRVPVDAKPMAHAPLRAASRFRESRTNRASAELRLRRVVARGGVPTGLADGAFERRRVALDEFDGHACDIAEVRRVAAFCESCRDVGLGCSAGCMLSFFYSWNVQSKSIGTTGERQ